MFTTKNPDSFIAMWLPVVFSMQARTIGGSNDTEQNADTVIPWRSPLGSQDVTTVIPLGNLESAARKSSELTGICLENLTLCKAFRNLSRKEVVGHFQFLISLRLSVFARKPSLQTI